MKPRVLDLFCGGGGSSYGARLAGAEVVCGIDSWSVAVDTFQENFPESRAVKLKLDETSAPSLISELGDIDVILASPECTNHSCAKGSLPRDEESRKSALYILNFVRELLPRWLILENVVSMAKWSGYRRLLHELSILGYNILEEVLDAENFGVPQTRSRLFVVCDRAHLPTPTLPLPDIQNRPTARDQVVLWDGPWPAAPLYSERRAKPTLERAERAMKALGKGEPFLIVYYGSDGGGGWQSLDRPIRTLTTLDRFGLVTWRGNEPMLRMLQPPELQRAMGLGADLKLSFGNRRDRIKLLGNGVCPPVMSAILKSLLVRSDGHAIRQRVSNSSSPHSSEDSLSLRVETVLQPC